jgi:hypothetical protein
VAVIAVAVFLVPVNAENINAAAHVAKIAVFFMID